MANIVGLPNTILLHSASASRILSMIPMDHMDCDMNSGQNENTNRALVQLGKLKIETGGGRAILRNSRGTPMSMGKHIIFDNSDEDLLESSNDVAESEEKANTSHECVSCMEEYPVSDIIQTECVHNYCRECIVRLFENSLANESLFPPRCCHLPIHASIAIEDMIGIEMTKRYKERKTEVSDSDRTYCSSSTCARYILPQNIRRGVGICEFCTVRTCTDCKREVHRGGCIYVNDSNAHDEKINDDLLEQLAKKNKWQRCPKCSRIIQLSAGCWHIR
ncbi:hypothetical protein N7491_005549 [Penicillium cf. griseofulvum]|uniref:RBR-type E3 ubiquitin transferase n=1 Tax=Penicillium cf. griseofulvum TaxID=2972120 RepID=A0A9W9J3Y5_9EURO|nr:hypothetical protein N7472_008236 [Penicillium cf. griseofulvum]KAJ5434954.1 hypothetical protein N7491_005549 [Penicillium cf. griseofulvum]